MSKPIKLSPEEVSLVIRALLTHRDELFAATGRYKRGTPQGDEARAELKAARLLTRKLEGK